MFNYLHIILFRSAKIRLNNELLYYYAQCTKLKLIKNIFLQNLEIDYEYFYIKKPKNKTIKLLIYQNNCIPYQTSIPNRM